MAIIHRRLSNIDHLSAEVQSFYTLRKDGLFKLNVRNKIEYTTKSLRGIPLNKISAQLCDMYCSGKTLQEIGDGFGVSRERIRQVLAQLGITSDQGGRTIKQIPLKKIRLAEEEERKERMGARILKKWGFTVDEWRSINKLKGSKNPITAFTSHRKNSYKRGIEFKLSFIEWWRIWQESGKWGLRGRGIGRYCMARFGDKGPYEVGNVVIQLATENSRDAILRTHAEGKLKRDKQ